MCDQHKLYNRVSGNVLYKDSQHEIENEIEGPNDPKNKCMHISYWQNSYMNLDDANKLNSSWV